MLSGVKMTSETEANSVWKLTILRNGEQGNPDSLEDAEFRFGRYKDEVYRSPVCRAPSGVIRAIREAGLEEQALESGLVVEMSSRPKEGWLQFDSVTTLTQTTDDPHFPGLPLTRRRTLFSSPSDESSLVFIDLTPMCRPNSKMPSRVWVRVTELNLGRLAWAVENGIYQEPASRQQSLHRWFKFESDNPPGRPDEFKMPGPI